MNHEKKNVYVDNDFESYVLEGIGVIKIIDNVYEIVTDIPESSKFIEAMKSLEDDHMVKAILITNKGNCLGSEKYEKYLNTVFSHKENDQNWTNIELSNRATRTRELVILNKLIKKIIHSPKLIISALSGEVVTPFFGAALATDIRLASKNTRFLFSHVKMNIHPSGALPYFLSKYIGQAKASSILFGRDKLTVTEARDLGLIMDILPSENFDELVIRRSNEFLNRGSNALYCTKRLLNSNFSDLENYIVMEECDFKHK